jgi:glycosyltransferase involved in cell wall biosynthesis
MEMIGNLLITPKESKKTAKINKLLGVLDVGVKSMDSNERFAFVMNPVKGGGPRNVYTLSAKLNEKGEKSTVVSFRSEDRFPFKNKPISDIQKYGAKCVYPNRLSSFLDRVLIYRDDPNKITVIPFAFKQYLLRTITLHSYKNISTFIATGWQTFIPSYIEATKRKKKLMYFVQADETSFSDNSTYKKEVTKSYYKPSIKFTQSKYLVDHFKEKYDQELTYIGFGINHDVFHPLEVQRESIIFTIYRDDPNKGFNVFVDAINKLWKIRKDFKVMIAGGNINLDKYKINFPFESVGWVSNDNTLVMLYARSIFVNTGINEALPMPPLEAMACKSAVITSRIPGSKEFVIESSNCLSFAPNSADDLNEKIEVLLDDENLRCKISEGGFVTAKRYNWDFAINNFMKLLNQ